MNVGIVIPVFNQLNYTKECLASLQATTKDSAKIVVVNNGSSDGTAEYLATRSGLMVIENAENRGCAAAWNQGVKSLGAEWTVLLNNDVVTATGWLEGLLSCSDENGLDVVTPGMREGPLNYSIESYAREYVQRMGRALRPGAANGICFMVRGRVFERVGFFDEKFQIGQFEDVDFFRRAGQARFKLGTTGRSFIHHYGSVTQNSLCEGKATRPYEAENRAYFRQKWGLSRGQRWANRVKSKTLGAWWRLRERAWCAHSLHEKWLDGKLAYY